MNEIPKTAPTQGNSMNQDTASEPLTREEAERFVSSSLALAILLDGLGSGIKTAAINWGGMSEEDAHQLAIDALMRINGDPLALEQLRQDLFASVTGQGIRSDTVAVYGHARFEGDRGQA